MTALRAVYVRGPFLGPTGYDHYTRSFVREMVRQGVAVQLDDLPEWSPDQLPPEQQDPLFATLQRPVDARVMLHFTMPHQVVSAGGYLHVNFTMFEGSRIPAIWVREHEWHHMVIVPTESSRRAWIEGGVPEHILRICPLGVDAALFGERAEPLPLERDNGEPVAGRRVRFLNISELVPRKNMVGLLRTWLRATTAQDDAILMLKLSAYSGYDFHMLQVETEAMEEREGKRLADAAPVHVIRTRFPDADMPRLYATATHYVSMSRGEGWDLPMVEAAASGLSLIAPSNSAYPAYLDPTVARMIPTRPEPVTLPDYSGLHILFEEGAMWWEPDEDAAAQAVRDAIDGRNEPPALARERVLRDLNWQASTRRLMGLLAEVEELHPRRRFWPWRRGSSAAPPAGGPAR